MQFQLLLDQALKKNTQLQQLSSKILERQERCLKNSQNEEQRQRCKSKRQHFQQYLEQYSAQFKQKGRSMCCTAMKEHHDIDHKIRLKDQCIAFYSKSIPLFESNVIDKLKSLAKNTDFSQL